MKIEIGKTSVAFREGETEAGLLVLDDPFKPYFHPLRTPARHPVTVAMPGDHRHHKGLMYALRCPDLNFWEESPGKEWCGVQEVRSVKAEDGALVMDLLWRSETGGLHTYNEARTIACRHEPERRSFVWTWRSRRRALRPHRLIKSEWVRKLPDGNTMNYHGLGIRLPWMWSFPGDGFNGVLLAGKPTKAEIARGTTGPEVTFWGLIDGYWDHPMAAVTMRQQHGFGWFVVKEAFGYIAAGPSGLHERDVAEGDTFDESYELEVADLKEKPAPPPA